MSHAYFLPVAAAILDWGMAEGATNFSHVFQPLGAIGVRHGCTGQLHNQLFTFGSDGKPEYKFKAGELLRGETDGSSYPNGGLRSKSMRRARACTNAPLLALQRDRRCCGRGVGRDASQGVWKWHEAGAAGHVAERTAVRGSGTDLVL